MELFKIIEKTLLEKNNIKLKIYSLNYVIELEDNKYIIYPELYINRKNSYNNLTDLFTNYTIYNENLLDNIEKIKII